MTKTETELHAHYVLVTQEGLIPTTFEEIPPGADVLVARHRRSPILRGRLSLTLHEAVPAQSGGPLRPGKRYFPAPLLAADVGQYVNPVPQVDPGHVVWCMILDAIKMFYRLNDHIEPELLYCTPDMETLLRYHALASRERLLGTFEDPLRPERLLGLRVIYDASDFRLA